MPPDRGLFLATTWRLHPDVCRFVSESFYEGRLEADPSCEKQLVSGNTGLGGTGLRFVPVEHDGNRSVAPEEVAVVAGLVDELVGRQWTDCHGVTRTIGIGDILVVAPYNAQVARLCAELPEGARVGTVDKFQGQEAPVVIFSMASSSADELPRHMSFLYSRNRLNVAVSRARALAFLVCSPALLDVRCRTPHEITLANSLCRFVELADKVPL